MPEKARQPDLGFLHESQGVQKVGSVLLIHTREQKVSPGLTVFA